MLKSLTDKTRSSEERSQHLDIHLLQILRNLEWRFCLTPNLLDTDALRMLFECQTLRAIAIEYRQIRDDCAHTLLACERERALIQDLRIALFVNVFHCDDDFGLCGVGDEVHGAADAFDFAGKHEVCEIWSRASVRRCRTLGERKGHKTHTSVLVDLHSTQHGDVDAPTSDHAEALVAAESTRALDQCDSFFARIDQIWIFLARLRVPPHAQDTVF
jgi:hypothetical protein